MLGGTVAVTVAPRLGEISLTSFKTLQWIVNIIRRAARPNLIWLTGCTVEVDKVLRTGMNERLAIGGSCSDGRALVLRWVTNGVDGTIGRMNLSTISHTHDALGLTVHVPVVGSNVGLIVLEVPKVRTTVYPPEQGTVELIHLNTVEVDVSRRYLVAGANLLNQNFHLSVTIHISDSGIVGLVVVGNVGSTVIGSAVGLGDGEIAVTPYGCNSRGLRLILLAIDHRHHGIGAGSGATGIGEIGNGEWRGVDLGAIAVDIIVHPIVFGTQDAPTQIDA